MTSWPPNENSQRQRLSPPVHNNEWINNLAAPELVNSWMDQPTYACMVVDQEGGVQQVNNTFLNWTGAKRAKILFQNISDLFSDKDFALLQGGMHASLAGESRVKEMYPSSLFPDLNALKICVNRYPLQASEKGEVVGVLFCMDLEDPRPAESDKPWLSQYQQKILDSLDAYLVLLDTQMRLLSYNKKFNDTILNTLPFEVTEGMPFLKMVPIGNQERYVVPFKKALKGETISQELKIKSIWWEIKHTPVYENGEITAVAISAIKIDDWVRMRNEFKLLTQELMRSNAELEQFAYITSHNLRAPVVNLVSLLGFVDRRQIGDSMNQQIFHKVDASALRLENTLQDLVQVVAIKDRREVSFERVNFRQLLDRLLEAMSFELIKSESMIQADFSAVREVIYPHNYLWSIIQNLLSNSMKYKRPDVKPEIRISSFRENGFIGIRIQDNGLGLDLDTYGDRLFGLYQRFHEGDGLKGKGLGLYIVKSQVESLNGRIEVESKVDHGSCFNIYLRDLRPL